MADTPKGKDLKRDLCDFSQKEAELLRTNPVFRAISANSKDFTILWDAALRVIYASPALESLAGYKPSDIVNWSPAEETIGDYIPPEHADLFRCKLKKFKKILRDGSGEISVTPWEMKLYRKDRSPIWIETRSDLLRNSAGEICGIITTSSDVTSRKAVEEALRESEEKFRNLVENINDVAFTVDNAGRISYLSPAIKTFSGYAPEELIGQSFLEHIHPDDLEYISHLFSKAMKGDIAFICEFRIITRSGAAINVRSSSRLIYDSYRVAGLNGILTDITEQIQSRLALEKSEAKFRDLVENINDASFSLDTSGYITYASPVIKSITGYDSGDMLGQHYEKFIFPEDLAKLSDDFFNAVSKGTFFPEYRFRVLHKDGRTIHVRSSNRFIYKNGKSVGINSILSDITAQVEAQKSLIESEEKYRSLIENINDVLFVIDQKGILTFISPGVVKMTGYTTAEILGQHFSKFIVPEKAAAVAREVDRSFETGEHKTIYTLKIMHKNGKSCYIRSSSRPLYKNGRIDGAIGIATDITEQVETQQALADSEARYRNLIENINDATYTINTEGIFTFMSPVCKTISGYTPEEITGCHFSKFVHPDDCLPLAEKVAEAFRTGDYPPIYEFRGVHKSGRIVHLRTSSRLVHDAAGQPVGMNGIMTDITRFTEAEEKIQQGERRYQLLAANVQDVIWTMDNDMRYSYLSPSQEKLTGYRSDETINMPLEQTMTVESYRYFRKIFGRHAKITTDPTSRISTDKSEVIELELLRKDGSRLWTESKLSFLYNTNGSLYEIVGITRDISERRQAEIALRRAKEETDAINRELEESINRVNKLAADAEMASIAKGEFLANMSHEIRTPMNGVIGMVELLINSKLTPEQQRYAETAQRSGEALLTIVNDILDFSKIEAGKMEIENINFDLRQTMEDISDIVAYRAHEKGLELSCVVEHNVPSLLQGDPSRIRQVILNLVGNAVKFTTRGEVIIRVTLAAETEKQAIIRFSVSDTGIGIRKDKLTALFGPFTQEDASITRKYGGTGLGLAISKRLTEMMGGKIGVESTEGKGTTFWFTVLLNKQPRSRKTREFSISRIRHQKILIVDDNATNRKIIKDHLLSWEAAPQDASDGEEALVLLRQASKEGQPFALAIIDMQMPGMDGESLGKKILADPAIKDTPMIMITSADRPGEAAHMKALGFCDYISKPVKRSVLAASLSNALGGISRSAQAPEEPKAQTPVSRPDIKTLIVEDNEVNQAVAAGLLENLGYQCAIAANGKQAIDILSRPNDYALVLMDLQMPEMDGFEATRIIRDPRSKVKNHDIPIIAITAHALKQDRAKCLAAGMDDYVAKPFKPEEIDQVIKRQLPAAEDSVPVLRKASPGEQTAPRDLMLFDREAFLERINGNVDLMQRVVKVYLDNTPAQLNELKAAFAAGDADRVHHLGHAIKGASANIEATLLRETAYQIESAGSEGRLDGVGELIGKLENLFVGLQDAIAGGKP